MMFRPAQSQATDATAFIDEIHNDVYATLESMGPQVADAWRERISVPVVVTIGPRGGRRVTERSKPGEPPRKDRGDLYESILDHVEVDARVLSLEVDSDKDYAVYLENMDRPHIDVTFEEWVDPVFDAVIEAVGRG